MYGSKYTCLHVYVYICICIYVYICISTNSVLHTCIPFYIYIHRDRHVHVHIYIYIYIYTYIHIYIYMAEYTCTCRPAGLFYMCVHLHAYLSTVQTHFTAGPSRLAHLGALWLGGTAQQGMHVCCTHACKQESPAALGTGMQN